MVSTRILLPALLAALGALTSCTMVPPAERDVPIARELALETPVAAALCAQAVRAALPLADPLPYAGGAPATEIDRNGYLVRYELRGTSWLPAASHRLLCNGSRVIAQLTKDLPGFGLGADRVLQLEIRSTAAGASVRGAVPAHLLPEFESAMARGLEVHAMAPPPLVEFRRALEFAHAGELDHARHYRDHAMLLATDPAVKALVQRQLAIPDTGPAARRHARERLAVGDLATARVLLHTARRSAPDPAVDYQLLWRLHRSQDDDAAAFASALLARECSQFADTPARLEMEQSGLADVLARLAGMTPAVVAPRRAQALPAAAPSK